MSVRFCHLAASPATSLPSLGNSRPCRAMLSAWSWVAMFSRADMACCWVSRSVTVPSRLASTSSAVFRLKNRPSLVSVPLSPLITASIIWLVSCSKSFPVARLTSPVSLSNLVIDCMSAPIMRKLLVISCSLVLLTTPSVAARRSFIAWPLLLTSDLKLRSTLRLNSTALATSKAALTAAPTVCAICTTSLNLFAASPMPPFKLLKLTVRFWVAACAPFVARAAFLPNLLMPRPAFLTALPVWSKPIRRSVTAMFPAAMWGQSSIALALIVSMVSWMSHTMRCDQAA